MNREEIIQYALHFNHDYDKMAYALTHRPTITPLPYVDAMTYLDEDYPKKFFELKDPPFVLFYQGNRDLLKLPSISIVGSRNPSSYAQKMTKRLTEHVASKFVIVSGLAKGIDAIAHESALENGYTIGILGCGINVIYPKENLELFRSIGRNHLLLSEYPPNHAPLRHQFPFRNRLIAALGDRCIVMAAAKKSGTMHTVNFALELGKEIYTIPYRADDLDGEGCNQLIASGACVLTNPEDFAMI